MLGVLFWLVHGDSGCCKLISLKIYVFSTFFFCSQTFVKFSSHHHNLYSNRLACLKRPTNWATNQGMNATTNHLK